MSTKIKPCILAVNCGSTSLKFSAFWQRDLQLLFRGTVKTDPDGQYRTHDLCLSWVCPHHTRPGAWPAQSGTLSCPGLYGRRTTTTPFDMVVLNEMLERHHQYICQHLEDMPEIRDWKWTATGEML